MEQAKITKKLEEQKTLNYLRLQTSKQPPDIKKTIQVSDGEKAAKITKILNRYENSDHSKMVNLK